jgi:hypothetical protein
MPASRKNLLIVRAGEDSLHPSWIRGRRGRNFDLLVSYYGAVPDKYRQDGEHYHVMVGPRWPGHHSVCRENAELIAQYDYVGFACDDLQAGLATWNKLFDACRRYALDLAQPAIEGFRSYDITRPHRGCILRYTNFVEVMCPVFSQRALQLLSCTFGESISGWGLSVAWWSRLTPDHRVAILDCVRVRHGRPIGEGTLYSTLRGLGVNAGKELKHLKARYGNKNFEPTERSRLMAPMHAALCQIVPRLYR